jgi:hypothetical protein
MDQKFILVGRDDPSAACGEGSDCINRALLIECTDEDCPCGVYCQNRRYLHELLPMDRFQKCDYAPMEIIKTNKKGYGLRALAPIKANQFVIEYCGEVIPQHVFIKRAKDYAAEGVKHFYFMSLMSGEVTFMIIDWLDCRCSKEGKLGSLHES